MSMNWIQFQPGMSLPDFLRAFGNEETCARALQAARWPDGFECPRCHGRAHCVLGEGSRRLFQCSACRHQASLLAGSLFASTKLPLTTWFLAIHLISQAKTGISALALKRDLGVSYPTAWLMHQKIMTAMARRDDVHQLCGQVQIDDAYLGGEHPGGKPGRGSENKIPFVAALQVHEDGWPQYIKLHRLSGFTHEALGQWAKRYLAPQTAVLSDGLGCFTAIADAGCTHEVEVVGSRKPHELPRFKWINTILGNLKTMISGAHKWFKYAKYSHRYLGAFAYRFNRRFNLAGMIPRLIADVAMTRPLPMRLARVAEDCF